MNRLFISGDVIGLAMNRALGVLVKLHNLVVWSPIIFSAALLHYFLDFKYVCENKMTKTRKRELRCKSKRGRRLTVVLPPQA
jgi:hypothetical protein